MIATYTVLGVVDLFSAVPRPHAPTLLWHEVAHLLVTAFAVGTVVGAESTAADPMQRLMGSQP